MKIEVDLSDWPGLQEALVKYDVVAFRKPYKDEVYINGYGEVDKCNCPRVWRHDEKCPILKLKRPTAEQIRNVVDAAVAELGLKVGDVCEAFGRNGIFGLSLRSK